MTTTKVRGRFAPTPSGFIHLGNIFCSLLAWLNAKSQGGKIILRIEDLDTLRCSRSNADRLAKDLEWLGLFWDEGAYTNSLDTTYFQSERSEIYANFFNKLSDTGDIYPCFCSRNELHAANAPHLSDGRFIYAGTCYGLTPKQRLAKQQNRMPAYRLHVPNQIVEFRDIIYGKQGFNLAQENGDFIVRRSDGVYAYQLAVTIDDALMGITEVVRGWDLLGSTPLQIYLHKLLGFTPPQYMHIPLLIAPDGRRLAKRDRDMDLELLRKIYGNPEPIIGYLAYLAGQIEKPAPISPQELLKYYNPTKIPQHNIIVPPQLPKLE